jgi:hypothetical protein
MAMGNCLLSWYESIEARARSLSVFPILRELMTCKLERVSNWTPQGNPKVAGGLMFLVWGMIGWTGRFWVIVREG